MKDLSELHKDGKLHILFIKGDKFVSFDPEIEWRAAIMDDLKYKLTFILRELNS